MSSTISTTNPHGRVRLVPGGRAQRRQRGHAVLFYEDDDYLLMELARETGAALDAGGAVVVLATDAHRDGLERRLRERSGTVADATGSGRYVSLDPATLLRGLMHDRRVDPQAFRQRLGGIVSAAARASGSGDALVFRELPVVMLAIGQAEIALQLEALWTDLATELEFALLCAYPLSAFGASDDARSMEALCAAHPDVIPAESFAALPTEADRMRTIALLQQKARALTAEIEANGQTRRTLAHCEDEARRAVDARDTFLWAAAHDFRTPVTSIRGYSQLLLRLARRGAPVDAGRLDAALATIDHQTAKLIHLIDRLLETVGGPEPILQIERAQTDVASLLRGVLARQILPVKHRVALDSPESLSGWVDPARFEQLVVILLDNAIRYAPFGGKIAIALASDQRGGMRLMIEDEGVGIPVEERETIFQRHHPASTSQHLAGMGLGLFVARQIVQQHGGRIHAEAPDHPGARFVVQLPVAAPAA